MPARWTWTWPSLFAGGIQQGVPITTTDTDKWSWYDVYSTLTITERVTYSGDAARNHSATWTGTIARRGGKLTESSNLPVRPNGFTEVPSDAFLMLPRHRLVYGPPADYVQSVESTETVFRFRDSYHYELVQGGQVIGSGLFSRELTREVTGLVTDDMMEDDVEELLDAVDFRSLDFVTSGTSGNTARSAQFDINGNIILTTLDQRLLPITKLTGETTQTPARNHSNLTGIAHPALWAGWTLNPIDIEPEAATSLGTGIDSRMRYLTEAQRDQQSDRFEVLGAKAFIERPPAALYGRQTGSEYHQRLGPDSCANLAAEIAGKDPILLGATRVDEQRHPGVQSVRPWQTFRRGAFLQISGTPC
ncbi:MAG TPA: hypothetical protein DEH78_12250 [Solibacterales bacterium]|nr:hypothetical protein [Bryobacterales bacterium]